jgi:hypothetical protein
LEEIGPVSPYSFNVRWRYVAKATAPLPLKWIPSDPNYDA